MRLIQSIILVSALFAFAGHSAAEPGQLHGSDSPELQEAVEGWLAGDDLEAL